MNNMNSLLFQSLISMFQYQAMMQLGKLMNPSTQKAERDLEAAKMSIDILIMLQEKTKGNLSEDEANYIKRIIHELRMNYVDELKHSKKETEEKTEEATKEATKEDTQEDTQEETKEETTVSDNSEEIPSDEETITS